LIPIEKKYQSSIDAKSIINQMKRSKIDPFQNLIQQNYNVGYDYIITKEVIAPNKVYYIPHNAEECSWSSQGLCAKHTMLECLMCFSVLLLPVQGISPRLWHKL
jgi:hypothetical protein